MWAKEETEEVNPIMENPTWHFVVKCSKCGEPITVAKVTGAAINPVQEGERQVRTNPIHKCLKCGHTGTYGAADVKPIMMSTQWSEAPSNVSRGPQMKKSSKRGA